MVLLEEFLGKLLGLLIKTGLSLIGKVFKPLVKSVLVLLGLTAEHHEQTELLKRTFLDQEQH